MPSLLSSREIYKGIAQIFTCDESFIAICVMRINIVGPFEKATVIKMHSSCNWLLLQMGGGGYSQGFRLNDDRRIYLGSYYL